jgi:hypothetical protein
LPLIAAKARDCGLLRCGVHIETGFCKSSGLVIIPAFHSDRFVMTQQTSTLYAKLLGETARIQWEELQPFFARGALLWVAAELDLIAVAEAMASNDTGRVRAWLEGGEVAKVGEAKAADLVERKPELWAVVISPWVLFQERASS